MNITKKLEKEIITYCSANDLDVDKYVNKLLKNAFTLDKYGDKPEFMKNKEEKKKVKTVKKKQEENIETKQEIKVENIKEQDKNMEPREEEIKKEQDTTLTSGVKLIRKRKLS